MLIKTQNWRFCCSSFIVASVLITSLQQRVFAQIRADETLPNNSVVTRYRDTFNINGGTKSGSNLFHSFEEFSVPTNGAASFNNGVNIENIIGRVTGGKASNIDGLIRANGSANLFLINPGGIIFGENAWLNIGGSFVGSTADAIGFGKDNFFSASNPGDSSSLLEVSPDALFFNQIKAASIQNNSAWEMRVPDGKSLLLVGGDINIVRGKLFAFGGRVELGGLAGRGTVGLNQNGDNLSLSFPSGVERSDISLSNGAFVNVSAAGGSIAVNARNFEMIEESSLLAGIGNMWDSEESRAGNIDINATVAINLKFSFINNYVDRGVRGDGGDVNLSTKTLLIKDGAQVGTGTFSEGNGGNLTVDAQQVQVIGSSADGIRSALFAFTGQNSTQVVQGDHEFFGGNDVFVGGNGGDLTVDTVDTHSPNDFLTQTEVNSTGNAGNLTINTDTLHVIDEARVSADTSGEGNAGNLTIKTNTLHVIDGAQVSNGTFAKGNGGKLTVDASDIQLIGFPTGLFASAGSNSTGDAGDLTINTNTLHVIDKGRVEVRSRGTGIAGEMTLNARSIHLNNEALITADTPSNRVDANREQATININSQDLIMTGNSTIRTNATGDYVIGGNINIDTDLLVGFENSDITANSANFFGGRVIINTRGILGIQPRDIASETTSDITATGANPDFSGTVELDSPQIDANSGLVELPTIQVDTEVAQGCYSPGIAQSSFLITGRGGLPTNPKNILTPDAIQIDWVSVKPSNNRSLPPVITKANTSTPKRMVEAKGAILNDKGQIVLTANPSKITSRIPKQNLVSCNGK